jgi:hypothetical protein
MEKTIKTSCPLPLIKLSVNMKYAAVEKPSGVGYLLLVLIKDAKNRNDKLGEVLARFGVPQELQFIFAEDIEKLLSRNILRMERGNNYQREYFDEYTIGNFAFTEAGERMFREGAIPTGEEKSKQATMYYSPLTDELSFNELKCMPIEDSYCYPDGFMDKVKTDLSGIKDFIIENASKAGLGKEERLLDCAVAAQENVVNKTEDNLELRIDNDGMEVSLKGAGAEAFYTEYFTPDMLERELLAKNKFKFSAGVTPLAVKGFIGFKKLTAVYIPEEYAKQAARPVKLLLTKTQGKISVKRGNTVTEIESGAVISKAASSISDGWAFITIDGKETRSYTAATVTLTEQLLDKPLKINLLVEETLDAAQRQGLLAALFGECMCAKFSAEYCALVKTAQELNESDEYITQYAAAKLKSAGDDTEKGELLNEANKVFAINPEWIEFARKRADEVYDSALNGLTKQNVAYTLSIAKSLDGIRKPESGALFTDVSSRLEKQTKDAVELFNLLTGAGFSENEALSVANVVEEYIGAILADDDTLQKSALSDAFTGLYNNLKDLKRNLGIKSTAKYTFREDYNINSFVEDFKAYKGKLAALKKYASFAPAGYAEFARYEEIMQPVFDYIMIERNATASPEKISEGYIRGKINGGDYRSAVGDMLIRLDYVLGKRLGLKKGDGSDVFEKIDKAKKEKIITPNAADALHELRKFRNKLQHPTEAQLVFDKSKITEWADAVFAISENAPQDKGGK